MSTIDSEDRNVTGYFLPEDTQLRLKQLREYVGFLTNLARPRRPDEDSECYSEIRPGEVAICFELIEEQIGLVLDELSWPAERGEPVEASKAAADAESDAEGEAADTDKDAEEPYVAEPATNEASIRYVAGVTLSQIDEMNLLLGSLRALGNVVVCSDHVACRQGFASAIHDLQRAAVVSAIARAQLCPTCPTDAPALVIAPILYPGNRGCPSPRRPAPMRCIIRDTLRPLMYCG